MVVEAPRSRDRRDNPTKEKFLPALRQSRSKDYHHKIEEEQTEEESGASLRDTRII